MAAAGSGMSRLGDFESGHGCWFPVVTVTGSPNVMVNKIPANKSGDITVTHVCGTKPPHPDKCSKGSKKVWVNKKMAMRVGDLLAPGGGVMCQGSHSVIAA